MTFTLGGSTRSAVTGADGIATVTLPLIDLPDDGYTLSAGFDGDAGLRRDPRPSSPFTVQRLATSLALAVTAPTVTLGADTRTTATLTSAGVPLAQKTVAFVLTAPSRPAIVVTRVTDLFGRAGARRGLGAALADARCRSAATPSRRTSARRRPAWPCRWTRRTPAASRRPALWASRGRSPASCRRS